MTKQIKHIRISKRGKKFIAGKRRYAYFSIGILETGERVVHRIDKETYNRYKKKGYKVHKETLKGKDFVPLHRLWVSHLRKKRRSD